MKSSSTTKETDDDYWSAELNNNNNNETADNENIINNNESSDLMTTSSTTTTTTDYATSPRLGNAFCCVPCLDAYEYYHHGSDGGGLIIEGTAYDIIVVRSADGTKLYQNSEFLVSFNKAGSPNHRIVLEVSSSSSSSPTTKQQQHGRRRQNNINTRRGRYDDEDDENDDENNNNTDNDHSSTAWFPVVRVKSNEEESSLSNSNSSSTEGTQTSSNKSNNGTTEKNNNNKDAKEEEEEEQEGSSYDPERYWGCCHPKTFSGKITDLQNDDDGTDITTRLSPFLKLGKNPIRYLLLDQKRVVGVARANIYLWSHNDSVVVSDIDGTITKSNAGGVIDTILTDNYQYCHDGVCSLLSDLSKRPNTQTLYVTSRPIRLASHTRQFLKHLRQGLNNDQKLPEGPILGFSGNIPQLLIMELISKKTHHFKADLLWKQVVQPFRKVKHSTSASPIFVAGFGNTIMDVQAYHMAGIDLEKIYLINKKSKLSCFDRIDNISPKQQGVEKTDGGVQQQELVNLTRSGDGLFSATIGIPMPRKWYKSMSGSKFDGYTDRYLKSHILSHRLDEDDDGDEENEEDKVYNNTNMMKSNKPRRDLPKPDLRKLHTIS